MNEILYKSWNNEESLKGSYGNKIGYWLSLEEVFTASPKRVVIRNKKVGSKFCKYDIPLEKLKEEVGLMIASGVDQNDMYFNEGLNDECLLIQGEVMEGLWDIDLRYSFLKTKMRIALEKAEQNTSGLTARLLLKKYLWPDSYDDLMLLLEKYKDHVIEFSSYDFGFTNNPTRNTIIWEVRKY